MQLRKAVIVIVAVLVPAAAACNDDGRTLRPARPDQVGSVSTLAPVTEPVQPEAPPVPAEVSPLGSTADPAGTDELALTSSFEDGQPIDPRHSCQGSNISPRLDWSPAPTGTIEIALTMIDLDAPDFVHWAMAGLDPLSESLGEGVVPEYTIVGLNGTGQRGYTGPCPPAGETHRYRITVHYLTTQTELADGSLGDDLILSIEGATSASAQITGTYSQG